jgi:hypothetical protein
MVTYDNDDNIDNILAGFPVPSGQPFKIIPVTHDESTFYENDRRRNYWSHKNDNATPQKKGEGTSLMVSDFLMTKLGRLMHGDE